MKNIKIMRLWRECANRLHIVFFDTETGISFEVVLDYFSRAKRERAIDIIWDEHAKTQTIPKWFELIRNTKSEGGCILMLQLNTKITIKEECLKYCFKAGNYYDFKRRLYLMFLMKGWDLYAEILYD